jgi:cullin 1
MQFQTNVESKVDTEVLKTVNDDRRFYIQALIVRIMKEHLKISHLELVDEIISSCSPRFKANMPTIKTCIESLIDKNYIARTEEKDQYIYVS